MSFRKETEPSQEELNSLFYYEDASGNLIRKVSLSSRAQKGMIAGSSNGKYIIVRLFGKNYQAHRLVWIMFFGKIPEGCLIDHINGNGLDNRLDNLRVATYSENNMNKKKKKGGSSKYKGVFFHSTQKVWQAAVKVDGKSIHLGTFDTEKDAKEAYDAVAKIAFGEFFNKG